MARVPRPKAGLRRKQNYRSIRDAVAQALCKAELNPAHLKGRPSYEILLNYCPVPRKKAKAAVRPVFDVRYDGFDHSTKVCSALHVGNMIKVAG